MNYVCKHRFPHSGRKYLSIVHGYRDENGKDPQKTIRLLAIWTNWKKNTRIDRPFQSSCKEMDTQRKQETSGYDLCINQQEKLSVGTDNMKNFGYAALSKIYELELDSFLKNRQRHTEDTFDANAVLQALTYLKIVAPAADSTFFIDRELFFEKNSGTEDEFYQGLMFLYHLKHPLHSWINEHITKTGMREEHHGVLQHPQLLFSQPRYPDRRVHRPCALMHL